MDVSPIETNESVIEYQTRRPMKSVTLTFPRCLIKVCVIEIVLLVTSTMIIQINNPPYEYALFIPHNNPMF